jgi:hypothetical protein
MMKKITDESYRGIDFNIIHNFSMVRYKLLFPVILTATAYSY